MQALLSSHPSSFSFSFSLPSSLTKEADPLADSAHVQRLIRIGVPWRQGTAWGACRLEACQRARKDPAPEKESRWRQGLHHPWTAPVSPNAPPSAPIQPVSREPSGGFEVEECLNGRLLCAASDHKARADSCTMLPISLTHFHKHTSAFHVYGSIVASQQTSDCLLAKTE